MTQTQPTYSFDEVITLVYFFYCREDYDGLLLLWELLIDEKKLYCLYQIECLIALIDRKCRQLSGKS